MFETIKDFFEHPFNTMEDLEAKNFNNARAANPFLGVKPNHTRQDFLSRASQTLSVLMGTTNDDTFPEKIQRFMSDIFGNKAYYHSAGGSKNSKMGIFGYLIGLPVDAVYALIPGTFYLLALLGKNFVNFADFIFKVSRKPPIVGRLLTLPLWFTFGLAGIVFGLTGLVGYGVTKPILYAVDVLVHDIVIPVVSKLTTLVLLPIVAIVHLLMKSKEEGSRIEARMEGSTFHIGGKIGHSSKSKKEENGEFKYEPSNSKEFKPTDSKPSIFKLIKNAATRRTEQHSERSRFTNN